MTKYTAVRLIDVKQLKRDAKRKRKLGDSCLSAVLDKKAKQLGYKHWADLMKIVCAFEKGCVYGFLHFSLDTEELGVLESFGFKKSDYLYQYASADLFPA